MCGGDRLVDRDLDPEAAAVFADCEPSRFADLTRGIEMVDETLRADAAALAQLVAGQYFAQLVSGSAVRNIHRRNSPHPGVP